MKGKGRHMKGGGDRYGTLHLWRGAKTRKLEGLLRIEDRKTEDSEGKL